MKISFNLVRNYVKTDLPPQEAAALLTNAGLEVEAVEQYQSIRGGLQQVVTGVVITCIKHPNADRLSLTTVDIGGKVLQIVCGAPNVKAGQKVVVATIGARLFPFNGEPIVIKKSNIRGQASEGMICAEDEIGLGASHQGIMVLPPDTPCGTPAAEYFKIYSDTIFEINITPNRADAISHIGVARELAAAINLRGIAASAAPEKLAELQLPDVPHTFTGEGCAIKVDVQQPEGCKRYSGIALSGVQVKESPQWLKDYLLALSVRPINNVVDATNFVMLETGQPLHAYNADAISGGKVIVRNANPGETITTLDGEQRKLLPVDLLICNNKEPMCIAGVYGGIGSGVKEGNTDLFIESACFNPSVIRKTARRLALHTDSAYRFERGTDISGTINALLRAVQLLLELSDARVASNLIDIYPHPQSEQIIELPLEYVQRLTGCLIRGSQMEEIFKQLGMRAVESKANAIIIAVPTRRMDISCPADLVEEIVRFYGLNNIPIPAEIRMPATHSPAKNSGPVKEIVGDLLANGGFTEIMNTSLTSASINGNKGIRVSNPLSADLEVLRDSLLCSALQSVAYNQNRRQFDLKLFEFGKTYHTAPNIADISNHGTLPFCEEEHLALCITGNISESNWKAKPAPADYYYLKGYVHRILERVTGRTNYIESALANPQFRYGLSYQSSLPAKGEHPVVEFGLASDEFLRKCDVRGEVFFADFNWKNLISLVPHGIKVSEVPRYPSVLRDLSLTIGNDIEYAKLAGIAYNSEKKLLKEVTIIDVYEGEGIAAGKKSYTLRFHLLDENKTLTDAEIDGCMTKLTAAYEDRVGAVIRRN